MRFVTRMWCGGFRRYSSTAGKVPTPHSRFAAQGPGKKAIIAFLQDPDTMTVSGRRGGVFKNELERMT